MKNNIWSKLSESQAIIIAALISVIVGGWFTIQAAVQPTKLEISATQTAEAMLAKTTVVAENASFSTAAPSSTQIPLGNLIMDIDFAAKGDGPCDDYDASKLGYEDQMYYIVPARSGYLAVCYQKKNLLPEGSLLIKAFPEGSPGYFGYGVIFGWEGQDRKTSSACIIGIRQDGDDTIAIIREYENDVHIEVRDIPIESLKLDRYPHILRVTLLGDGRAYGYLDEKLFVEHRFVDCNRGSVGFVAYGPGDYKIYFDDLEYYNIP